MLKIYGIHACKAILANKKRVIKRLLITKEYDFLQSIPTGITVERVNRKQLENFIASADSNITHQGICVECQPLAANYQLPHQDRKLVMVLDQVQDPHNVGAIIRSCVAFGCDSLVVHKYHAPKETATMVKAASGAYEHLDIHYVTNIANTLMALRCENDAIVYGFSDKGSRMPKHNTGVSSQLVLVMGKEGSGLRQRVMTACDHIIALPTTTLMPSLNVANATSVALYHFTQQITF